jgi:DNA modification methylase
MTQAKVFASSYPRNEQGWIQWPNDNDLRKQLYVSTVSHPAKNNLFLYRELIEYLTVAGQIVLDPMLGAGSAMIGATIGRKIIGIELNHKLAEQAHTNAANLMMNQYPQSIILVTEGDCTKLLPVPIQVDLIIFSPPYANQLHANKNDKFVNDPDRFTDGIFEGVETYTEHPDSFSNMPEFMFRNNMRKVYRLCFANTNPGGCMAVIIKDRISGGEVVEMGLWAAKIAQQEGWQVKDWFKSEHIGKLWGNFNLSRGIKQITYEHDICFVKPQGV